MLYSLQRLRWRHYFPLHVAINSFVIKQENVQVMIDKETSLLDSGQLCHTWSSHVKYSGNLLIIKMCILSSNYSRNAFGGVTQLIPLLPIDVADQDQPVGVRSACRYSRSRWACGCSRSRSACGHTRSNLESVDHSTNAATTSLAGFTAVPSH